MRTTPVSDCPEGVAADAGVVASGATGGEYPGLSVVGG